MSAKDNFAQAMKELLNGGDSNTQNKEAEEKKTAPSSFSSFSQPEARPVKAPAPEKKEEQPSGGSIFGAAPVSTPVAEVETEKEEEVIMSAPVSVPAPAPAPVASTMDAPVPAPAPTPVQRPTGSIFGGSVAPAAAPVTSAPSYTNEPAPREEEPQENGSVTVIAAGTVIVGDITVSGGLCVNGSIKGNVKVANKLELNGKIIGDIQAEDAVITASTIKGSVITENSIDVDGETTIIGDVTARTAEINGKIKGNLTVDERGSFQSKAILVGNLVSGTVIIDEGAMLKGDISITSAQKENVTVEEPDFDIEIE